MNPTRSLSTEPEPSSMSNPTPLILRRMSLLSVGFLAVASASCDQGPAGGVREGLNESITCPEGFVGWNFGSNPIPRNTQYFQQASGTGGAPDLTPVMAIEIVALTCAGVPVADDPDGKEALELQRLRNDCGNRASCTFNLSSNCPAGVAEYNCGSDLIEATSRFANGDRDTSMPVTLACPSSEEAIAINRAAEESRTPQTGCVPALCHGASRRDTLLNCVPDSTLPTVVEPKFTSFSIEKRYSDYSSKQNGLCNRFAGTGGCEADDLDFYGHQRFYEDQVFRVSTTMEYPNGIPPEARLTVWFADQYVPSPASANTRPTATFDDNNSVYAFRCMATKLDVGRRFAVANSETNEVSYSEDLVFSKECSDRPSGELFEEAASKAGLTRQQFQQQYTLLGTRAFLSYDVEGETVFARGQELATTCQPNPPPFYYDASNQRYDWIAYYNQRKVEPFITKDSFTTNTSGEKEFYEPLLFQFAPPTAHHQGHVGPLGITVDGVELTVRRGSPTRPSLPVSLSWYAANFSRCHAYSPRSNPGCPQTVTGPQAPGAALGELRADVYLWPVGEMSKTNHYFPRVGSIALTGGDAGGANASAELIFTPSMVDVFFDSSSPMYLPADSPTKAYNVFYCMAGTAADARGVLSAPFETRFFGGASPTFHLDNGAGNLNSFSLAIDEGPQRTTAFFPDRHATTGAAQPAPRGCRFAETPVMITADRLVRAVEPISGTEWTSSPSSTTSGDGVMAGSTVNDATSTNASGGPCGADDVCTVMSSNSGSSSGNMGQSYYATDTMLRYQRGGRVKADLAAEAMQFPMLDLGDDSNEFDFPVTRAPITITVAPNFEPVAAALQRAVVGRSVRWLSKRVQSANGIGVGWARSIPINIGPIPGEIVVTATVAIGVEGTFKLEGVPEAKDAYPCLGASNDSPSKKCTALATDDDGEVSASFDDASVFCSALGGRLGEPSTASEATSLATAIASSSSSKFWIGGQAGYRHVSEQCARTFDADSCVSGSGVSYRWLSNDAEFASATGLSVVTGDVNGTTLNGLTSGIPRRTALTMDGSNNLELAFVNDDTRLPFVCVFDHADTEAFVKTSLSAKVAIAAGLGLGFCVPMENPGACVTGTFNIVALEIEPTLSNTSHILFRGTNAFGLRNNTNVSIPWKLSLFSGDVTASVNVLLFSAKWELVKYDGFVASQGSLYDFNLPVQRNY